MDPNAVFGKRKQGRPVCPDSQRKRLREMRECFDNNGGDELESDKEESDEEDPFR
jgi:hypothetical protein